MYEDGAKDCLDTQHTEDPNWQILALTLLFSCNPILPSGYSLS
jgi:predicted  nucleic acid-binding Zn ribbon protein